jgi:hypothetical protein
MGSMVAIVLVRVVHIVPEVVVVTQAMDNVMMVVS